MSKLKVLSFSISLDGYGAGPAQSLQEPLGIGGEQLHDWLVTTRTFHQMTKKEGGSTGVDEMLVAIAPVLLGSGEALLGGIDLPALGYGVNEHVTTPSATHVVFTRN